MIKFCAHCGKNVVKRPDRQQFCSYSCTMRTRWQQPEQREQMMAHVKGLRFWACKNYEKICVYCGISFVTHFKFQKFCGVKCGQRFRYERLPNETRCCMICESDFVCKVRHPTKTCSWYCTRKYMHQVMAQKEE